jgi:hypothetical protein
MNVRFNLRLKNLAQTIYLKPKVGQKSYDFSNINFKDPNSIKSTLKNNFDTFVDRVRDEIASAEKENQTQNTDASQIVQSQDEKSATHQIVSGDKFIKEEIVNTPRTKAAKSKPWDSNLLLEQHSMFVESLQPEVVEDQLEKQPKYVR